MSADNNSPGQSDALRLVALGAAAAPQIHQLRDHRVTVGAAADNDLLLNEPTVSRHHAALQRRAGRWYVVDLGSTNGTYLNGRRVVAASPAPLERGDELHFGNARFGLVAPGDDLEQVIAGRNQGPTRAARRGPRRVGAALAAVALSARGRAQAPLLRRRRNLRGSRISMLTARWSSSHPSPTNLR